ncbi:MAG: glycosyltransferase family A protein [Candidatus Devosia phytovorans]|uniref:Glycosyltransferase family A protein n=1 Tax=Candidatus Devosia phytovorans TaxID=3121372 RepID=A0AAJ6AZ67_9HYPH|nr:glycosyltransferase family A protein [Devosia sp.]WEK03787.1 MAG: glycosyltransferase family A protein [Devosia sp.]
MSASEKSDANQPLVSIGIPTYNRPELLERTLSRITRQTYKNIEVIISDNASPDPRVQEVIDKYKSVDKRVKSKRQSSIVTPYRNFIAVLQESCGEYFMWAADDDAIEGWFVQRCVDKFLSHPELAFVTFEANYFEQNFLSFDFFSEGSAFRETGSQTIYERAGTIIRYGFGNLVYGMYRRDALVRDRQVMWERTRLSSANELPLLLLACQRGEFLVMETVGLHKSVPRSVYEYAVWENTGGWAPDGPRLHPKSFFASAKYHLLSYVDVSSAVNLLEITAAEKLALKLRAAARFASHFACVIIGYKPRLPRTPPHD